MKIRSICISLSQLNQDNPTFSCSASERNGDQVDEVDIQLKLGATDTPEDFRDWLRQALALVIEEL